MPYSSEQWTASVLIIRCHGADVVTVNEEKWEKEPSRALNPPVRVNTLVVSNLRHIASIYAGHTQW